MADEIPGWATVAALRALSAACNAAGEVSLSGARDAVARALVDAKLSGAREVDELHIRRNAEHAMASGYMRDAERYDMRHDHDRSQEALAKAGEHMRAAEALEDGIRSLTTDDGKEKADAP